MNAQIYCTLADLIDDLNLPGDEPGLFSRIQTASGFINRRFGDFIPRLATRKYSGNNKVNLEVDYLLSVSQILNDSVAVSDYDLYPLNRHWENGPYTRIYNELTWEEEVEITGAWGKFSETEALGESVSQTDSANNLSVTNASILSPGMVLLAGDEQELVTGYDSPTLATSQLAAAVDIADENISVDDGAEFNRGEVIQLSTEDCYIKRIVGNLLWVARGWNNTIKQSHAENDPISVYRTFEVTRAVNGTTAAAHTSVALYRYLPPYDVNWLCRQIAGLMRMKAASGFAGKTGNADTGETFYFNEFPSQVKEIQKNYRVVQL
jgi:hypothetical protein